MLEDILNHRLAHDEHFRWLLTDTVGTQLNLSCTFLTTTVERLDILQAKDRLEDEC